MGFIDPQVNADSFVSLNGRLSSRFVKKKYWLFKNQK
jgi:hypothetical protein